PRLYMLMSMRSDFLGELQKDEPLFKVHCKIDVPPLREAELREVVSRPAELLSARFETAGLADIITRRTAEDSVKDVGALPLLSYTLDDMWTQMVKRGDGVLRLPAQSFELGGVLIDRADAFLAAHPKSQDELRRIFTLKLATVREGEEPTRRRALRSEFSDEEWRLVSELANHPYRLLVTATPEGAETYAELAHEAIIRRWGKLRDWITAEREFLAWRTGLEAARRTWQATPKRSKKDALLRGEALTQAQSWLARRSDDIPEIDRDFIVSSRKATRGRRLRKGAFIGTLVFTIVIGLPTSWYTLNQLRDAYLAQAITLRGTLDPERRSKSLALLAKAAKLDLLVKAARLRVGNDLRDEAVAAMGLVELQNPRAWNGLPLRTKGIGFNSNLERYARGDDQGNISIRRIVDDNELMHAPGFGSVPWVLRFSPDDRYLAAKYDGDQLKGQLYVWDLSRPGTDAKYFGTTCNTAFDFDPSSQVLAVGRCDGSGYIDLFDLGLATSMPTKRLKQTAIPQFIAFRPDGRQLAVSSLRQPAVQVLELNQDKAVLNVSIPAGVMGIAWNADGGLLAAAADDHRIYVWDVANLR